MSKYLSKIENKKYCTTSFNLGVLTLLTSVAAISLLSVLTGTS